MVFRGFLHFSEMMTKYDPGPGLGQAKTLQLAPFASPGHLDPTWIMLVGSQRCQNGTRITPNMHGQVFTCQIWISESGIPWGRQIWDFCIFCGFLQISGKTPPKNSHFFLFLAIQRTKSLGSTWFFLKKKVCRSIFSFVHFYGKWVGGTRKFLQP